MKRWDGEMEHEEMGWRNGNMKKWDGGMGT